MKKLLTLFMALILTVSSANFVFAENDINAEAEQTSQTSETNKISEEAREFIEYFEVFDSEKGLDSEITRAEFSVYLARVLGINEYSQAKVTYYKDVTNEHWAAVCINNLTETGAFTVADDKMFRPNDKITVEEAVKIIINLLGYENSAILKGGYSRGYMEVARKIKLLDNVSLSGNLIHEDAAELLLNMINVDIYEASFKNGELYYSPIEGKGILSIYRDMYIVEGTVKAVNRTALREGDEADGTILIDNVRYNYSGDGKYIGQYVKAYYTQVNETDIPEVNFLVSKMSADSILEIDAKNIESFTKDYVLEYYKNDKSAKVSRVTVPRNASVIYNGIAISNNIANKMNIKQGTITLLKTKGSQKYDVVIIREYETFVVSYVDSQNMLVVDAGDPENSLDLSGENGTVKIFDSKGNEVKFAAIGKNYALTVYETPGKYIEVYVSQTKVTGVYSETIIEDETHYIRVNKQKYKVSDKYYDDIAIMLTKGREIKFIVDMFGEIAYIDTVGADSGYIYAWYINQNLATDEDDEKLYIKVYTETDGVKRYVAAEKVKIDGKNVKKPAVISNELTNSLDRTAEIMASMPQKVGSISSRLIRIKLNTMGQISQIDTPYTGSNESKSDALYIYDCIPTLNLGGRASQSIYINGTQVLIGLRTISDNSTFNLTVPTDDLVLNATEKMFSSKGYEKNAEAIVYKTSPDHGIADVIVTAGTVSTSIVSTTAIMVSNITTGLDEDERVVEYVEGYLGQTPVQYTMSNSARAWNGDKISMTDAGVEIGDLVALIFNAAGEIETYFLAYDCSEDICYDAPEVPEIKDANGNTLVEKKNKKVMFTNNAAGSYVDFFDCFYNYGTFTKGFVNTYNGGVLGISFEKGGKEEVIYYVAGEKSMVYEKELKKNGFRTGTAEDLVTYQDAGNACATVVAVHHAADWWWYYIYR